MAQILIKGEHAMTKVKSGRASGVLVLVLALVNGAAVWGQAGWALENIVPARWSDRNALVLSLAFAAAIELIGVFLAMMADQGEDVGLPSGGVRLGSYAVGLVSGSLNFSHWYASGLSAAIAFGFLSAVSPFLWGIWSRVRRGRLAPPSRHFWHPVRSVALIRDMAWHGLSDEDAAVRALSGQADMATDNWHGVDSRWSDDGHGHAAADCPDAATDIRTDMATTWPGGPALDMPDRPAGWTGLPDTDTDPVATRPQGDLEAWERGYEDALDKLSADMATEAEQFLATVTDMDSHRSRPMATDNVRPLPQRTRTPAGSVPAAVMATVREMSATLATDRMAKAALVRTLAADNGVTERTARRWVAAVMDMETN